MDWASIPVLGTIEKLFTGTKDLISESITDVDKANEIIGQLDTLGTQVKETIYLSELATKTIPWVDALHKMGRQLTNYLTLIIVGLLVWHGHVFTQWDVILLTGGTVAYQVIKGKGK